MVRVTSKQACNSLCRACLTKLAAAHLIGFGHIKASLEHAVQGVLDQAAIPSIHQTIMEDAQILVYPQPRQHCLGIRALQWQK